MDRRKHFHIPRKPMTVLSWLCTGKSRADAVREIAFNYKRKFKTEGVFVANAYLGMELVCTTSRLAYNRSKDLVFLERILGLLKD